jgi:hypothetical protein
VSSFPTRGVATSDVVAVSIELISESQQFGWHDNANSNIYTAIGSSCESAGECASMDVDGCHVIVIIDIDIIDKANENRKT